MTQEFRNRKALLNNVRNTWITNKDGFAVLEKSLHEQIPIVLRLENHPSAVASPWNMEIINPDKSRQLLPEGTHVIDVFDKLGAGRTLLILGESGAGKTITLLQLARDLIARAEEDISHRIPVVLNLSSWAMANQSIAEWIVEELNSIYQVPRKIGQQWVEKQELLLLLDGLDEIRDLQKRNACVTELNVFYQEQATEIVVCCRMKEYEKLGDHRLKLCSALVIKPLITEQIRSYLDSLQLDLTVLKTWLIGDVTLQDLAQSPLLLNIMVFTYQGIEVADININTIASNRKKQLFDDYINRIFQGSRLKAYHPDYKSQEKQSYSQQDVMRWLIWMSKQMVIYSQSPFLIEKMQPTWLTIEEIIFYSIGVGLIIGIYFGLVGGLIVGSIIGLTWGLLIGLIIFLTFCLPMIQRVGQRDDGRILLIQSIESVKWHWIITKKTFNISLIFGLIFGLLSGLTGGVAIGLISGLISCLTFGLVFGLLGSEAVVEAKLYPNQGIWKSVLNALIFGLPSGLIFGLIGGASIWQIFGFIYGLINCLGGVLIMGIGFGLNLGGLVCIQHLVLRLILYFTGRIPWDYAKFLDWASDKLFLQKVGGGYIFIHRSLMEHFAEMESSQ